MARIRTINQAYNLIKFDDPDTAISEFLIRRMVLEGKIPAIKTGNRLYVDVDVVQKFISKLTGADKL